MSNCVHCKKPAPQYHNYCSWKCSIDEAKANGGKVITPNNLPIRCIAANGDMLECENGDHKDYKFPVEVEYVGVKEELPDWDNSYCNQTHALIYSDGFIAITIHECCYCMWHLKDGSFGGGRSCYEGWRLTEESVEKIMGV